MNRSNRTARLAAGVAAVAVIDLGTKLAAAHFAAGARSGLVVPVHNPQFSLGTPGGARLLMLAVAVAGIAIAARFTVPPARRGDLALWVPAALLGGAAANLVDRAAFGAVHDFLATPWVVFNVADIAVLAGLAGLAGYGLRHSRRSVTSPDGSTPRRRAPRSVPATPAPVPRPRPS